VSTFIYCPNRVSISADSILLRYEIHARRNILPQHFTCKQICTGSQVLPKKLSETYLYLHVHRITYTMAIFGIRRSQLHAHNNIIMINCNCTEFLETAIFRFSFNNLPTCLREKEIKRISRSSLDNINFSQSFFASHLTS